MVASAGGPGIQRSELRGVLQKWVLETYPDLGGAILDECLREHGYQQVWEILLGKDCKSRLRKHLDQLNFLLAGPNDLGEGKYWKWPEGSGEGRPATPAVVSLDWPDMPSAEEWAAMRRPSKAWQMMGDGLYPRLRLILEKMGLLANPKWAAKGVTSELVAARMVEHLLATTRDPGICRDMILGRELVRWVSQNLGKFVSSSGAPVPMGLDNQGVGSLAEAVSLVEVVHTENGWAPVSHTPIPKSLGGKIVPRDFPRGVPILFLGNPGVDPKGSSEDLTGVATDYHYWYEFRMDPKSGPGWDTPRTASPSLTSRM